MFIQGCATAPGTNHAPEWLSPLETDRTTYGCGAKYGNCQARLNMHIWRRVLHQITTKKNWRAPSLWCLRDRQTDRPTEGPLSFAVSVVKTLQRAKVAESSCFSPAAVFLCSASLLRFFFFFFFFKHRRRCRPQLSVSIRPRLQSSCLLLRGS